MTTAVFWLFHRITALILMVGLPLHLLIMHNGISFPWHSRAAKTVFLLSAVYHAAYGLWGLAVEYLRSGGMIRKTAQMVILFAAIAAAVAGF
ncbi:MAG: hypothetical protein HGA78_09510 [Nitrospirales bacterium]|nr:hypothetical protein [Nitrospirales bacterium]